MGACASQAVTEEQKEARKKNAIIDKDLDKERRRLKEEVKLLLLGTGESGKSTIFKQMKIISALGGFTNEERAQYKVIVYANCITQMKVIAVAAAKLKIDTQSTEAASAANRISAMPAEGDSWSEEVGRDIKTLWSDGGIQETYKLRDKEYQLNDTANYFFDNIDRINKSNYTPDLQDILRARVRSTGIEEAKFNFDNIAFTMVDVGGQRSERRKWIHCFQGVKAVLFTVSLSEYDQKLREDATQNRSKESLLLFDEIFNNQWFEKSEFMLFLNKIDLFEKKIKVSPLSKTFPEYTGGADFEQAKKFMEATFNGVKKNQDKKIHTHFTCAVNTENVEFVFQTVRRKLFDETVNVMF